MQEVVGAVHGVDHPGPAAGAGNGGPLLAQDAVLGPAALQLLQHIGFGGVVGGRHHIRNGRFLLRLQAGHAHQERQLSGLAHQR